MQLWGGKNNDEICFYYGCSLLNDLFHKKKFGFQLPYQPYAYQDTERAIEIPWALSCIGNEEIVLDVGYAFAEPRYLNELCNLQLKELHGVDYVLNENVNSKMRKSLSDIRRIECFSDSYFDTILCVSTIEHVGFDNSIYFKENNYNKSLDDDLKVIQELVKILKKGGRLVITIPFGKKIDYGWFMQYDIKRLNRLINHSGCTVNRLEYFIYKNDGWYKAETDQLINIEYKSNNAPAAAGIACLLLIK